MNLDYFSNENRATTYQWIVTPRFARPNQGFCNGAPSDTRVRLAAPPRNRSWYELLHVGRRTRVEPWARLWAEGNGAVWRDDATDTEQRTALGTRVLE